MIENLTLGKVFSAEKDPESEDKYSVTFLMNNTARFTVRFVDKVQLDDIYSVINNKRLTIRF